jgi:dephospho-CoA kinase
MAVFAITGDLGSGKSTVLKFLKNKGAVVFDADKEIHKYYQDKKSIVYKKIISLFPSVVENGLISRKELAKIVFSDRKRLATLERIVHPVIIKDLKEWIKKARKKKRVYIAEIPLLFEKNLQRYFDGVILIYVKRKILIPRIRKKYSLSKNEIMKRLSLYISVRKKIKKADFIVDNNSSFQSLKKEVDDLWIRLKEYSKIKK